MLHPEALKEGMTPPFTRIIRFDGSSYGSDRLPE